jgi:hypothetical protein
LLCYHNREYLQFEAEKALAELGWARGSGLLSLISYITQKRIKRGNLWAFSLFLLNLASDDQFDHWFDVIMSWAREL